MKTEAVQFLKEELAKRLEKNPRYSLRAFAKSLGLNVGSLSGLLNGKRNLTVKVTEQLCERLGLTPIEKSKVVLSMLKENASQTSTVDFKSDRIELDQEIFRAISDWYHWGILQLVRTEKYLSSSNHSNPRWIARQLQINETEAKMALERLLKLDLLKRTKEGFYKRTKPSVTTADKNVTSAALKKWQKQIREKALYSLEHDPIDVRSMTSMTMAINPRKIKEAKKLIDEFETRLAEFLEQGKKEQVYQLCVSLFPIQIREN